jgi:hypothetical protein
MRGGRTCLRWWIPSSMPRASSATSDADRSAWRGEVCFGGEIDQGRNCKVRGDHSMDFIEAKFHLLLARRVLRRAQQLKQLLRLAQLQLKLLLRP